MKPLVLAITGASGSVYGVRLLATLLNARCPVELIISPAAIQVFKAELGIVLDQQNLDLEALLNGCIDRVPTGAIPRETIDLVTLHDYRNYAASIASGSFLTQGMVICPCSMDTLASVSHGLGTNLIHRAAAVHLKERRKLVVVPRETPLSSIHLANMTRLSEAGAVLLPAMPGFYHQPATIDDLVDFVVARICDQLEVPHNLMRRWGTLGNE